MPTHYMSEYPGVPDGMKDATYSNIDIDVNDSQLEQIDKIPWATLMMIREFSQPLNLAIYAYLKENGKSTEKEIAEALDVDKADIHDYLMTGGRGALFSSHLKEVSDSYKPYKYDITETADRFMGLCLMYDDYDGFIEYSVDSLE